MLDKRMEVRPQHLEGMTKLGEHVVCAGGLTDGEGKLKGSVIVVDFDDRTGVDEYLSGEPYVVNNVWEKVTVEPINVVIMNGKKVGK